MILIISHDQIDEPTNDVIEWLRYFGQSFTRLNGDSFKFSSLYEINIDKAEVLIEKEKIMGQEISVIFYRRWKQSPPSTPLYIDLIEKKIPKSLGVAIKEFNSFLWYEFDSIRGVIFNMLNDKYWIPHHKHVGGGLNKINLLKKARDCGLNTPDTIVSSSKNSVQNFKNTNGSIINKAINEVEIILYNEHFVDMYTKEVTDKDIKKMQKTFFPSLFQKKIDKQFEIRTFFIEDEYYSMAIFSQNDDKTKTDFRNYNLDKPNRCVPFNLPPDILNKLKKLMKIIDLNTGSIDLIVCEKTSLIYFLEVNPVGQLGMVSMNCNYYLEEKIALNLKKYEEKK